VVPQHLFSRTEAGIAIEDRFAVRVRLRYRHPP